MTKLNKDEESKPLTTFAPPPLSAVISIVIFVSVALYYFPSMNDDEDDDVNDASIFTKRVFPDILSVNALLCIRLFFVLICFIGFISGWYTPAADINPPYRPQSRAPRIPFKLGGWKKQYAFTSWSWNILGISFAVSAYIGYQVEHQDQQQQQPVDPMLVRLGIILWEVAAPMTLLIGAVVKYALWPAQIKKSGHGDAFLTPRALLQHNANVIMAVSEAALMGGLPIKFSHISISVLYGCAYVVFNWSIQMAWHGQGPAFLYFFMDTTIGLEHTIALNILVGVLVFFHGLFCGVESILVHNNNVVGNSLTGHVLFTVALCCLVCRFRD